MAHEPAMDAASRSPVPRWALLLALVVVVAAVGVVNGALTRPETTPGTEAESTTSTKPESTPWGSPTPDPTVSLGPSAEEIAGSWNEACEDIDPWCGLDDGEQVGAGVDAFAVARAGRVFVGGMPDDGPAGWLRVRYPITESEVGSPADIEGVRTLAALAVVAIDNIALSELVQIREIVDALAFAEPQDLGDRVQLATTGTIGAYQLRVVSMAPVPQTPVHDEVASLFHEEPPPGEAILVYDITVTRSG